MFESTVISGQIYLGKQGEHCARRFSFNDVVIWKEIFGEGRCELIHQRNGDSAPYPVVLTIEDGVPYWCVSEVDTAYAGMGKCEVRYIVDDAVVKSNIYTTFVQESLGEGTEEAPEPQKAWVERVIEVGIKAEQSAEQAEEYANSANVSKSSAGEYAEQSRNYAIEAETHSRNARQSAEFADLRASDAGVSSMTAQTAAEQAQESANFVKESINDLNTTFANALKGNVSGTNAVRLNGVSPLPHSYKITTETETSIKAYGKNLCDVSKVSARNALESVTQIDNTTFEWNGSYFFEVSVFIPEGTSFRISHGELVHNYDASNLRLNAVDMVYEDGTSSGVISPDRPMVTEKNVKTLRIYKSVYDSFTVIVKNLQIEIGNIQTEFEEYKEPIDGAVLVYPTTTLMADTTGAKITVEYNKDINTAIAELTAAIISLGGMV